MDAGIIMTVAAVAGALAATVWASACIRSGVYVRALCRANDRSRRVVALTFDDGPHPEHTSLILDALARRGVKAAFFVVGEKAAAHPAIMRRIVAEGHLVGNHTHSHSPRFPLLGRRRMREELRRCAEEIEKSTGARPTLFRPPFGVTNPAVAKAAESGNYKVAGWDVRSLDTTARWARGRVLARVRRRIRPGSVVLLHDDRPGAGALLEMILEHLESNNYTVERFDKLLGL